MVTKEDCEMMGKDFVPSHDDGKGGPTRAYCRKRTALILSMLPERHDEIEPDFGGFSYEKDDEKSEPENPVMEVHSDLSEHRDEDSGVDMDDAGKHYKIPRSNIKNAKTISKDISVEDKKINHDLRGQDFEDIPHQAERIEHDADKESRESHRLFETQRVFAEKKYGDIKNRISKRETKDKTNTIKSENKVSKRAIQDEKRRIRHEKKEARRKRKLDKLSKKRGDKGGGDE